MLELDTWKWLEDDQMQLIEAELARPKPRWRTVTVRGWERDRLAKGKLVEPDYLVLKHESGGESHYLLGEGRREVVDAVTNVDRRHGRVEREREGLVYIPRWG